MTDTSWTRKFTVLTTRLHDTSTSVAAKDQPVCHLGRSSPKSLVTVDAARSKSYSKTEAATSTIPTAPHTSPGTSNGPMSNNVETASLYLRFSVSELFQGF